MDKINLKLGMSIGKVNHIICRKMDSAVINAIDDNLTISQAYVIDFIACEGKYREIFQKDLEKELDLKRSSVSLMLNNMEKNDLIKRVSVTDDARLKQIILTEKSLKIYEKISAAINSVESKLVENLKPEEIKTFLEVIDKIRNNLSPF